MSWQEASDIFGNMGQIFNSIDEYADSIEEAFGWRPVINDNGLVRCYLKHYSDGRSCDVFEGEKDFVYSEWLNKPNWFKLLEPVEDEE